MAATTPLGSIYGSNPAHSPSATPPSSEGIEKKLSSITAEQTNAIAKGIASSLMNALQIDILGNLPVEGQYNIDIHGNKHPIYWPTYASNSPFLKIATPIIEGKILTALSIPGNVAEKGIAFLLYDNYIEDSPCGILQAIKEKYHDPDKIEAGIKRLKLDTLSWVKVMTDGARFPSSSELVFHIRETINGAFVGHRCNTIQQFESDARHSIITI